MSRLLVPMRYLGLAVALGLFTGGCKPQDAPIPAGSVATITPFEANLGRMHSEDERDVVFAIRNAGDAELLIDRVETTCGCMRPRFPKRLAPGEAGEIVLRFVPDIAASGLITEGVKVFTNADKEPTLLKFQVDLEPPVRLSPGTPLVMPVEPGGIAHQMITATPRARSGVEVTAFKSQDPRLVVERIATDVGPLSFRMRVTTTGAGDFEVTALVRTTFAQMREVPFVVRAEATRGPVAAPPILRANAVTVGVELPPIRVFARDRLVKVLSVSVSDPALDARVTEPTSAGTSVRVTYRGGWRPGTHNAKLIVQTDHPEFPRLEVPIVAVAR